MNDANRSIRFCFSVRRNGETGSAIHARRADNCMNRAERVFFSPSIAIPVMQGSIQAIELGAGVTESGFRRRFSHNCKRVCNGYTSSRQDVLYGM